MAPIELTAYFVPQLLKKNEAAIMNVSSGLGFVPLTIMPVYCCTKAALHSFSISLRHQLKNTNIKVFEIIPPMVDTELGGSGRDERGARYRGISVKEFIKPAMKGIKEDVFECTVGQSANLVASFHTELFEEAFNRMND